MLAEAVDLIRAQALVYVSGTCASRSTQTSLYPFMGTR
jgi:hypothetical protein